MSTAEERIKTVNGDLHNAIVRHIGSAPDPRSARVIASYQEKWSVVAAWNRLEHELNALAVEKEDAEFLEHLQDGSAALLPNLKARLESWLELYPMVAWSFQYTNGEVAKNVKIVMGDIAGLKAKDLKVSSLDYIRDLTTARALRKLKGAVKSIPNNVVRLIYQRKLGRLYWVLSTTDALESKSLFVAIEGLLEDAENVEFLDALVEQDVLDLNKSIDAESRSKMHSPSTLVFGRFLRYVFDKYLVKGPGTSLTDFISTFWDKPQYAIDEEFAYYIVTEYLKKLRSTNTPRQEILLRFFIAPLYHNVGRMLLEYPSTKVHESGSLITIARNAYELKDFITVDLASVQLEQEIAITNKIFAGSLDLKTPSDRYIYNRQSDHQKSIWYDRNRLNGLSLADYVQLLTINRGNDDKQKRILGESNSIRPLMQTTTVEKWPVLRDIIALLTPKNKYRACKRYGYKTEWGPIFIGELPATDISPDYWKPVENGYDVSPEVVTALVARLGYPPSELIDKRMKLVLHTLPKETLLKLAGKETLVTALAKSPKLIFDVVKITGLTVKDILGDLSSLLYEHSFNNEDYIALDTYEGEGLDWKTMLKTYLRKVGAPNAIALQIILKHTPAASQTTIIVEALPHLLREKKGFLHEYLPLLLIPSVVKILTPGLLEEAQRIIKESAAVVPVEEDDSESED